MTKLQTINAFENAISHQAFFMTRLQNVAFKKKNKDILDLMGQEKVFGDFFYDKNNDMEELIGGIFFEKISKNYDLWEQECKKFYNIFVEDVNLPKPKLIVVKEKDYDIAKSVFSDIANTHKVLKESYKLAEARLNALSDKKFRV